MMDSQQQALVERLHRLQQAAPDIEASALISMDGLIIASALPEDAEEDRISAMSAPLLALSYRMIYELNRGYLEQVLIRGTDGDVLLISAGNDAVLTVIARKDAKLGLMLYYMKRAAKELSTLL